MRHIIGLTGKKSAGKTTVADYLQTHWLFTECAFAEPLKRGLIAMFGISDKALSGTEMDKNRIDPFWGVSGRQLAQVVGAELFRDYLPTLLPQLQDIWIRRMEKTIEATSASFIVISDIRYTDEARFVREHGGIVLGIERDNLERTDPHQSENQSIMVDHILQNNGTREDLYRQIDLFMREWSVELEYEE